jgi:hypothetical protein
MKLGLEKEFESIDNLLGGGNVPSGQSLLGRWTDSCREDVIRRYLELDIRQVIGIFSVHAGGDGNRRAENDRYVLLRSTWWEDGSERSEHVLVGLVVTRAEDKVGIRVLVNETLNNLSLVNS